jgi:hypothetical protein
MPKESPLNHLQALVPNLRGPVSKKKMEGKKKKGDLPQRPADLCGMQPCGAIHQRSLAPARALPQVLIVTK